MVDLHDMWMAERRNAAGDAFDRTLARYQAKYPKAMDCLAKDRTAMLAFYDFPAEHWIHIRTSNRIESTFRHGTSAHQAQPKLRLTRHHLGHGAALRTAGPCLPGCHPAGTGPARRQCRAAGSH